MGMRWHLRRPWVICESGLVVYVKPISPVFLEGGRRYTNADTCSAGVVWSSKCSNKSRFDLLHPRRYHELIPFVSCSQVDPKTSKPIPAHADTLWEVEVKTASPVRNTPEMPLSVSVEAVMEVQILMKGLLDLRRQDS